MWFVFFYIWANIDLGDWNTDLTDYVKHLGNKYIVMAILRLSWEYLLTKGSRECTGMTKQIVLGCFGYLGSGSKRFLTVSNGQKRFLGLRVVNKTLGRSGSWEWPTACTWTILGSFLFNLNVFWNLHNRLQDFNNSPQDFQNSFQDPKIPTHKETTIYSNEVTFGNKCGLKVPYIGKTTHMTDFLNLRTFPGKERKKRGMWIF